MTKRKTDLGISIFSNSNFFKPINLVEDDFKNIEKIINENKGNGSYTLEKIDGNIVNGDELYLTENGNIFAFGLNNKTVHEFNPKTRKIINTFDSPNSGGRGVYYKNRVYSYSNINHCIAEFNCSNHSEKIILEADFEPVTIYRGVIYSAISPNGILKTFDIEKNIVKENTVPNFSSVRPLTTAFTLPSGDFVYFGGSVQSNDGANVFVVDRKSFEIKKRYLYSKNGFQYGAGFTACWTPKGVILSTTTTSMTTDSFFLVDDNGIREISTAREILDNRYLEHCFTFCLLNNGEVFASGESGYVILNIETDEYRYFPAYYGDRLTRSCRDLDGNIFLFSASGDLVFELENSGYKPFTKEQLLSDYLNSGSITYCGKV